RRSSTCRSCWRFSPSTRDERAGRRAGHAGRRPRREEPQGRARAARHRRGASARRLCDRSALVIAFATVLEAPPRRRPVVRRRSGYLPPPPPPTGGDDGPERDPEPRRPFLDNARLATLFLIGGELMFFGGLVVAFFVLRIGAPVWPPPDQPRLPVGVTGV